MAVTEPPNSLSLAVGNTQGRGLRSALRSTDFRRLWLATVSSQFGIGMQQVLLGWLVLAMTGSESMVGILFAVRSTPNLVVGLAVGSLTDRLDRRLLMRLSLLGMVLTSLAVTCLLFAGRLQVWQLLIYTGVFGTLQVLEMTARQAYVYDMLGTGGAAQGIALISIAQRFGSAGGAVLAGAVFQWWGAGAAFLIMSLSYSAGVWVRYTLRQAGIAAPASREPLWHNVVAYMQVLRTNHVMRSLMVSTATAEILGFSHQVMLPILAKEVLQIGPVGLGVLTAFRFLGGTLGAGLLTLLSSVRRQGPLLLMALALFGGGEVLLGYASQFWFAAVCVTFINVMAAATDVLHQTLLQCSVSNEQRGRAMGAWVVGAGTAPVGQLEIGHLAGLTSAQVALSVNGLALVVLAVVLAVGLPRLRQL
jgi:MFS family permease